MLVKFQMQPIGQQREDWERERETVSLLSDDYAMERDQAMLEQQTVKHVANQAMILIATAMRPKHKNLFEAFWEQDRQCSEKHDDNSRTKTKQWCISNSTNTYRACSQLWKWCGVARKPQFETVCGDHCAHRRARSSNQKWQKSASRWIGLRSKTAPSRWWQRRHTSCATAPPLSAMGASHI